MNSTGPSNSTSAILCSLDGRRSAKELYVKFFVVHFTTLAFFFHLARRRDGKYLGWGWALYVLAPLNIVFRYVLALLGILGFYCCKVIHGCIRDGHHSTPPETIYIPLRWLLGKAPDEGYSLLPTGHDDRANRKAGERLAKAVGKAFVIGVFLTQCAGSIFLYHRRRQRDAVALVDQRVFELACGGLVIGILTLGLSFNVPIFSQPVPGNEKNRIDRFALFCRDSCSEHFQAFDKTNAQGVRIIKNVVISLIISLMSLNAHICAEFSYSNKMILDQIAESPAGFGIYSLICLTPIAGAGFYIPSVIYKEDRVAGRQSVLTRRPFLRWILSPVCSILGVLGSCAAFYLALGCLYIIADYPSAWFTAFDEVSALSAAPEDVACPKLWSDPLSQWIWWLA